MAKVFRIDIESPIWSTKSVGINLAQCDPDDMVEVSILYTNKKGRKPYPHLYLMQASSVYKYPATKVKGVALHQVPIKDFNILS